MNSTSGAVLPRRPAGFATCSVPPRRLCGGVESAFGRLAHGAGHLRGPGAGRRARPVVRVAADVPRDNRLLSYIRELFEKDRLVNEELDADLQDPLYHTSSFLSAVTEPEPLVDEGAEAPPVELSDALPRPEDLEDLAIDDLMRVIGLLEKRTGQIHSELQEATSLLGSTARSLATLSETQDQNDWEAPGTSDHSDSGSPSPIVTAKQRPRNAADEMLKLLENPGALPANASGHVSGDNDSVLSCVVQHPGAMCCSNVTQRQIPDSSACEISITTVARQVETASGIRHDVPPEALLGLASQAILKAARELCVSQTRQLNEHVLPEELHREHKAICDVLQYGRIIKCKRNMTNQFGHESYIVTLQDASGRTLKSLFKPRAVDDFEGWHRVPIEWVAYRLNNLLGMDYVPPVSYRTGGVDVDYTHFDEGAFIYLAANVSELHEDPDANWGVKKEVLLSDTRILDVLLHNSDRHHGHFLLGEHWVRGRYQGRTWVGNRMPVLIDHAAGFRSEALVTMEHENAFLTGPVRVVSSSTYLRLRFLDAAAITSNFKAFLSEREMRELLQRRNAILEYLDNLVDEQGYEATVIEDIYIL